MKFELPFATPSNNAVMRMHHRDRTRQHTEYTWQVKALGQLPRFEKCHVTVIRYGNRLIDFDNMGGGLKFLMDAMVKNNILADDSPKCVLSLKLWQEKCKRADEKTVVMVEQAEIQTESDSLRERKWQLIAT